MEEARWRWYDALTVLAAGLLGGVVAGLLATTLFGTSTSEADFYFWFLIPVQNLAHIGALALLCRLRGFPDLASAVGLVAEPRHARWALAGAAVTVPLAWLAAGLRTLAGIGEEPSQAIVEAVMDTRGTTTVAAVVVGVVVLGPVAEEMLHRGLVHRLLEAAHRRPATIVVVTAAVFSLIHLADPALYSAGGAVTLLVLFLFGLFLGVLRVRTGSLGAPIFAHSGFNLITVIALYFFAPDGPIQP